MAESVIIAATFLLGFSVMTQLPNQKPHQYKFVRSLCNSVHFYNDKTLTSLPQVIRILSYIFVKTEDRHVSFYEL